jgi:hypothetical protein
MMKKRQQVGDDETESIGEIAHGHNSPNLPEKFDQAHLRVKLFGRCLPRAASGLGDIAACESHNDQTGDFSGAHCSSGF